MDMRKMAALAAEADARGEHAVADTMDATMSRGVIHPAPGMRQPGMNNTWNPNTYASPGRPTGWRPPAPGYIN